MAFIIVYSTTNNKPYDAPNWRTVTEKDTLDEAIKVFDIWKNKAENEDNTRDFPVFGKIIQVAIFKLAGRDTFTRRPRYYADYRDKSNFAINTTTAGPINAMNSDYSMNKPRKDQP